MIRQSPNEAATADRRRQGRYWREKKADEQAHFFRAVAFVLMVFFAVIPAILLGWLGWTALSGGLADLFARAADGLGPWPVGVFIAGVFAGFIAVFGFLAKGAFNHPRRKDGEEKESSDSRPES